MTTNDLALAHLTHARNLLVMLFDTGESDLLSGLPAMTALHDAQKGVESLGLRPTMTVGR